MKLFFFLGLLSMLQSDDFNLDAIFTEKEKKIKKKIIKLEKFSEDSKKSAKSAQKDFHDRYEYVAPSSSRTYGINMCYGIRNENLRNACVANARNDANYCHSISSNTNMMYNCIATIKRESTLCFSITNENLRNSCVAIAQGNSTNCYTINYKNEDMVNNCLAITKGDKNICMMIKNDDERNNCLSNF